MEEGEKGKEMTCSVEGCEGRGKTTRGWCDKHYARWRMHGDPLFQSRNEPGSGYQRKDGYRKLGRIYEHRIIIERALGHSMPAGAIPHHVDENPSNNENSNLVLCQDESYHLLLHRRMRALKACGNKNWRKCVFCHKHDSPENLLVSSQGRSFHQLCRNNDQNKRYAEKRRTK